VKKRISYDPLTGIETIFHDRPDTDGFTIETRQDIDAIIKANKAAQNDGSNGWSPSRELKHVASIPFGVLLLWSSESGVEMNDPAFGDVVKRKLNDPDMRYFRTGLGVI
jgi:hypothetical protein